VNGFEEWYRTALPDQRGDANFEVRRLHHSEFHQVYDLVDEAFGRKRSRAEFDWLYRQNPLGFARCWAAVERHTGRLASAVPQIPWPLALGEERIDGMMWVDWVTAPRWRHRKLGDLINPLWQHDPWMQRCVGMSWPNEKSRRWYEKYGKEGPPLGPLPLRALPLRNARRFLRARGWPALLAAPAGFAANGLLRAWSRIAVASGAHRAVAEVGRFDSAFADAIRGCMTFPSFWSPHDPDFLNWRYLDHPTRRCVAFACGDAPAGFCVVQLDGKRAILMELVAPPARDGRVALALLHRAIGTARAAGCAQLESFAPPRWPHWRLLRRLGFVTLPSHEFMRPTAQREIPGLYQIENWQLVPGDKDSL